MPHLIGFSTYCDRRIIHFFMILEDVQKSPKITENELRLLKDSKTGYIRPYNARLFTEPELGKPIIHKITWQSQHQWEQSMQKKMTG